MKKLRDIMAFYCIYYPHKRELSKARLTKLVYLADWFSCLLDDNKMTNIDWVFNHYGPYVDDIQHLASLDKDFDIINETTVYGSQKQVISFNGNVHFPSLTSREEKILRAIIEKTQGMYFNEFIDYVYSTYPVSSSERYANLNLVSLARKYNSEHS